VSGLEKLRQALTILEKELESILMQLAFEPRLARVHVKLRDGTVLYIRYNNHGEYSYSVIFSSLKYDRCRFDNYDDTWNVSTRPNHFHPRMEKDGVKCPMVGDPTHDIPLLCNLLRKSKLEDQNFRF
jgi:hypothetical protein